MHASLSVSVSVSVTVTVIRTPALASRTPLPLHSSTHSHHHHHHNSPFSQIPIPPTRVHTMTTNTTPPSPPASSSSLPAPFTTSPEPFRLITRGAEALLYHTPAYLTPSQPAAIKIRPKKYWRHPTLDARLTKARILAEARVLVKCTREGVPVPGVLGLDWEEGWIALEWIVGRTVRDILRGRCGEVGGEGDGDAEGDAEGDSLRVLEGLLRRVGQAVGRLHACGIVHGDLTTSNMMVREEGEGGSEGEIVLIDFGLASQTQQEEERAVDLYVLERAFGSTHPQEEGRFGVVLEAYGSAYKGAKSTLRRLEDVRMRGRKKSMLG